MPLIPAEVSTKALLKRFALIYLPIVIVLSGILLSSGRLDEQSRMEIIKVRENNEIDLAKSLMKQDFEGVNSDLRVVANLPVLQHYLDSGSPMQRDELANFFLVLSKEKRHYDKVRYLDASGQEVIRINYNDGKPAIVPHEKFQNKSKRYFFNDAFRLNRGEIYVSPLDLNVEENHLEIPYKPTIRFGTPVFDSAGHKKGILLFNYFGNDLLLNFHKAMQGGGDHRAMLPNRDGYWLGSSNHADEWGFMLGKSDHTFGHDFADEWRTLSTGEEGTLLTAKGLFIYSTVHPLLLGQRSSTGSDSIRGSSQKELLPQEYYWKIMSFTPHAAISDAAFYNKTGARALLVLAYLLLALLAWIFAIAILSRKQAQVDLRLVAATFEAQNGILISTFYKIRPELQLLFIFCSSALLMAAYEFTKEFIFKGSLTSWESHAITILVAAILVTRASLFMRKLTIKLSEQLNIAAVAFESQEGILVTDANNVIIRVNNSFTDITGYTAEEVIGKNTRILGSGLHDAKFFATMWETLNDMGAWAGEIHNRRKNGETYQTSLNITAVKNQNGIVANYVSTFTDITGRKQAEEILRKTNVELSLFRKLLDSSSDAIETLDPITLRFLDVNEKACRDLGYSREELLSMSIFDIDPSFDQDARKMIGEQIQKTGAARFESTHRRKDGSTFAVEISIGSANLDNPYGLCVVRDITERKLVEEKIHELNEALEAKVQERTKQLVQAQEELGRKEKLAVLGQVAGSVGHELRNPLGVMNNAVYYLQTVLADADSTVKEYLNIIKYEIAGSERIVSDLLDAVRTQPPRPQAVGVAELIGQTLGKLTLPPSVTVKLDIPATLPALRVDAQQIHQVLRNLISNGVEAMTEGGMLEIRADENRQDGTVSVKVQDSGSGMTPEHLGQLFQPLFTTKARGIGLGLVVVKNLTEANGGTVTVESEIGNGTTFTVTLPADDVGRVLTRHVANPVGLKPDLQDASGRE